MIQIDKDVPIPEVFAKTAYPFRDMSVGDSFLAAGKTPDQMGNACSHWRKRGMKFIVRKEETGTRVWRTE